MISKEFFNALDELETQKNIKKEVFIETLETALTAAFKKNFDEASNALVKLDADKKTVKIIKYKTVVEEVEDKDKEMTLEEAKKVKRNYKIGDRVEEEVTPKDFGRIAIQTAIQVIRQKIREIEKEETMKKLSDKMGMFLSTTVTRVDDETKTVYVRLEEDGILEGVMNKYDQIPGEQHRQNDPIKVYVKDLKDSPKGGPTVLVTRSNAAFVEKLFELQIPEIENKEIEIVKVVREAGSKTKIAIKCDNDQIDAVGACVGNKSMRINNIIRELNGEKVDIVMYNEDPYIYIENALSPASVNSIIFDEETQTYTAYVPNNKLSLAIGKSGINVKLAAKLTGYKINIIASDDYLPVEKEETIIIDEQEDIEEDYKNDDDINNIDIDIDDLFAEEE